MRDAWFFVLNGTPVSWRAAVFLSYLKAIGSTRYFFFVWQAQNKLKKELPVLSVNAEAIDNKPVFDKYLTPQAITLCCLYL